MKNTLIELFKKSGLLYQHNDKLIFSYQPITEDKLNEGLAKLSELLQANSDEGLTKCHTIGYTQGYNDGVQDGKRTVMADLQANSGNAVNETALQKLISHYCHLLDNIGDMPIGEKWAANNYTIGSQLLQDNNFFCGASLANKPDEKQWNEIKDLLTSARGMLDYFSKTYRLIPNSKMNAFDKDQLVGQDMEFTGWVNELANLGDEILNQAITKG